MTASIELDLKQRLAKLSERDMLAMSAYLLRLKHSSKSGSRGVSKLMKEMDAGEKNRFGQTCSRAWSWLTVIHAVREMRIVDIEEL